VVVILINALIRYVIVGNREPVFVVPNVTVMQKVKNYKDYLECLTYPNYKFEFNCVLIILK